MPLTGPPPHDPAPELSPKRFFFTGDFLFGRFSIGEAINRQISNREKIAGPDELFKGKVGLIRALD